MNLFKKLKKNKKGFTLVELIVVLVILAILAAIAVPTFMSYVTRAKNQQADVEKSTVLLAAQTAVVNAADESYTGPDKILDDAKELSGGLDITAVNGGDNGVISVTFKASNGKEYTWSATDVDKGGTKGSWGAGK